MNEMEIFFRVLPVVGTIVGAFITALIGLLVFIGGRVWLLFKDIRADVQKLLMREIEARVQRSALSDALDEIKKEVQRLEDRLNEHATDLAEMHGRMGAS